ncbi:hypothetical protein [Spirillospora sp. NPDC048823]|uniref:hypothetical protein n=1 Tax=unclassified Spirillospora TaxID=2642701 RepID=UPI00371D3076
MLSRDVKGERGFRTTSASCRVGFADFHTSTRGHWSIENLEHRPRDTVWQEGDQQAYLGNGPRNTAALRNLALGALAINGITKITETVQKIGRTTTAQPHYSCSHSVTTIRRRRL